MATPSGTIGQKMIPRMMYSLLQSVSDPLTSPLRSLISGVMGCTSLACWIVLLMPQLIEQWRLKSAEGIAIGFISIWFLGDVFNLAGSLLAHLLPEVVFIAVWFCFADFLMIFSYVYYTYIYKKHHHHNHDRTRSSASLSPNNSAAQHHHHHHHHQLEHDVDENEPLVSRRRRSSTITNIAMEPANHSIWTRYVLPILFVVGAGAMGYFISTPGAQSPPDGELPAPIDDGGMDVFAQVLGYLSAALYLGARIPQIIQNYQRKSVYGLSLLFFMFLTLGNLTYAGQILFYRSDSKYILLNLSWLLGSLGTIFEDCVIFFQFYIYGDNEGKEANDQEAIVG